MTDEKKRPIRTCVACRSSDEKRGLLRIVRSATGEVSIDPTGKRPGRGAYVCRKLDCISLAIKKKSLERALRTAVPASLIEELKKVVQEYENEDR